MNNKDKINEVTSSASSGSIEAPFVGEMFTNKSLKSKELENDEESEEMVELTESNLIKIAKKLLITEFVYNSPAGKSNPKNINFSKETDKSKEKLASIDVKPENSVPNDNFKQNDELETERGANSLLDIQYQHLPDKAKKQMKDAYTAGDNAREKGIGNAAGNTEIGKKHLEQAKKRSDEKNKQQATLQLGDDIELANSKVAQKNTIAESMKGVKKIKYKKNIYNQTHLEETVLKTLKNAKNVKLETGNEYLIEGACGNSYKFTWNGNKSSGYAVITEHVNAKVDERKKDKVMKLFENKFEYNITKSVGGVAADMNFNNFLKQTIEMSKNK